MIGVIAAVATGVIATIVILPLELTGTTAIFSTPWMFKDIGLQDALIAVSALVVLAAIAGITTTAATKRDPSV
ncbi:MAG: hypothetical protein JSS50_02630 [Proteobacteria bacterium]|nr:hypothetical protein [Pseudomonadota bacterium]